jgi:hypothetical protein
LENDIKLPARNEIKKPNPPKGIGPQLQTIYI